MMFKIALISLFVVCSYALENDCRKGSKHWCKDVETASKCGVVEYCKLNQPGFMSKPKDVKPVLVELYYESLCPGCRAFMMSQLYPTFLKLKDSGIMDIKLYPYGNADETQQGGKWQFECQHGAVECEVNLVETCALHMMSHPVQFMPYIHCVEQEPSLANSKQCADQLQKEWGPISNCYNGTQGNHLEHEMAVATGNLSPQHQYVPWILGNGIHTETLQRQMQVNLLQYVCDTYQGTKPSACQEQSVEEKCYKNQK